MFNYLKKFSSEVFFLLSQYFVVLQSLTTLRKDDRDGYDNVETTKLRFLSFLFKALFILSYESATLRRRVRNQKWYHK